MTRLALLLLLPLAYGADAYYIGRASDPVGCFVGGTCSTGTVMGGSDRLSSKEQCLAHCKATSGAEVFVWSPGSMLCTCYADCGGFSGDAACPQCVGGEIICEDCFSSGS